MARKLVATLKKKKVGYSYAQVIRGVKFFEKTGAYTFKEIMVSFHIWFRTP